MIRFREYNILSMVMLVDLSLATTPLLLLQSILESLPLVLIVNLLFHVILIFVFLGATWKRNNSDLGVLKVGKVMLFLYIAFLVIDALIYIIGILQGNIPYMLVILSNPVLFFIFLGPPAALMYFDLQLQESSGLLGSLSNYGLALLVWLVVIIIAAGFTTVLFLGST